MIVEQIKPERRAAGVATPERPAGGDARTGTVETIRARAAAEKTRNRARVSTAHFGRKQMATVVVASCAVTLLCLYVSAYARVTAEAYEASRLARQVKLSQAKEETLRAEISRLSLPVTVSKWAEARDMIPTPPAGMQFLAPVGEGEKRPLAANP